MIGLASKRVGGVLLVAAGITWIIKAVVIIATGQQPDLLFQTGLATCALALWLLLSGFRRPRRTLVTMGAVAAGAALVAAGAAGVMEATPGAAISHGDDFIFPYSALVLLGGVGVFIAMLSLGMAYFSTGLPFKRTVIPLAAALTPLPAVATGFIHAELPILLIGLSWATAGAVIAVRKTEHVREGTVPEDRTI